MHCGKWVVYQGQSCWNQAEISPWNRKWLHRISERSKRLNEDAGGFVTSCLLVVADVIGTPPCSFNGRNLVLIRLLVDCPTGSLCHHDGHVLPVPSTAGPCAVFNTKWDLIHSVRKQTTTTCTADSDCTWEVQRYSMCYWGIHTIWSIWKAKNVMLAM